MLTSAQMTYENSADVIIGDLSITNDDISINNISFSIAVPRRG